MISYRLKSTPYSPDPSVPSIRRLWINCCPPAPSSDSFEALRPGLHGCWLCHSPARLAPAHFTIPAFGLLTLNSNFHLSTHPTYFFLFAALPLGSCASNSIHSKLLFATLHYCGLVHNSATVSASCFSMGVGQAVPSSRTALQATSKRRRARGFFCFSPFL